MDTRDELADAFTLTFYERTCPPVREADVRTLSIQDAYQVQDRVSERRIARGESLAGYKVGCTSNAIRKQFGLTEPITGRLFHPYIYEEGVSLDWQDYAGCAIEPEMVLCIGKDLQGEGLSDDELVDAIAYVSPGIELHHFTFWFQPPSSQELICTGGIWAGLVVGDTRINPENLSFRNEQFSVHINDRRVTQAPASEIMGGPLHALRWLVDHLSRKGKKLEKGQLVIPGSPVELIRIDADAEVEIKIDGVGALSAGFRSP